MEMTLDRKKPTGMIPPFPQNVTPKENSMNPAVVQISKEQCTREIPEFHVGDTVNVHVRIKEGSKERIQQYNGVVIARNGSGVTETVTVRRVAFGEGVERVFPLQSPNLAQIDVVRRGKVRRAKLYYLRGLAGKKARIQERRA